MWFEENRVLLTQERSIFFAGFFVECFLKLRRELHRLPSFEELAARVNIDPDQLRLSLDDLWQHSVLPILAEIVMTYSEELDASKVTASARTIADSYKKIIKKENRNRKKQQNQRGK